MRPHEAPLSPCQLWLPPAISTPESVRAFMHKPKYVICVRVYVGVRAAVGGGLKERHMDGLVGKISHLGTFNKCAGLWPSLPNGLPMATFARVLLVRDAQGTNPPRFGSAGP